MGSSAASTSRSRASSRSRTRRHCSRSWLERRLGARLLDAGPPRAADHMERLDCTGYLAQPERLEQLLAELRDVRAVHGSLVLAEGPPQRSHWAQNVWLEPYRLTVG